MKKIPYATQWIDDNDIKSVVAALKSSNLTQGPIVNEFERQLASYCGARYAVAVNSGTSALHIACLAAGIKKGDEVITSPNTFVASANCILFCGGTPVFADIEEDTAIIDPKEIERKITKKTKAIIPVHFAGHPANMQKIHAIAKKHNLIVIEDAAHALGAQYRLQGSSKKDKAAWVKIGSCRHSDMSIISFHAVKHITTGEGGVVLTNDKNIYERLIFYRSHGITRDKKYVKKNHGAWYYEMHELGFNYRITDIQCALGISQLKKLEMFIRRRRTIGEIYNRNFKKFKSIKLLKEKDGYLSSRHLFLILTEERKTVFDYLRNKSNILVNVHYLPVYLHPYYRALGYKKGLCPNAENYYSKTISIPMHPKLTGEEVEYVINEVKTAVEK